MAFVEAGEAPAPPLDAARLVARVLARQRDELRAHEDGVLGDRDPEDVHRMRVALRRLRATLRVARPLLDVAWVEELTADLRRVAGALGPLRDLDVLLAHVEEEDGPAEAVDLLGGDRAAARETAVAALSDSSYAAPPDWRERSAAAPPVVADAPELRELAAREFRKLRRAYREGGAEPTDEQLHASRIRGKRARYAVELVEPLVGKKALRYLEAAKRFQDVVGEHQDAVVAEARLRELLPRLDSAGAAFELGRLVERERARRARARAELPAAWAELERRGSAI
jgi:CHAD domain-containing protein